MIRTGQELIEHVLKNYCTDLDCEIHNPEIGLAEGTISQTNLAFYLAGVFNMQDFMIAQIENASDAALSEVFDTLAIDRTTGAR